MQAIESKLQLSLRNWDFNTLESYYELLLKSKKNYMDYFIYLYQTGQINKIKKIFNFYQNKPDWWIDNKINISYENLISIINNKEIINSSDVSLDCFACLQLNNSIYNGTVDVELLCKRFFQEYRNKLSTLSKKYYISKVIDLSLSGEKISKYNYFNNENQIKDCLFFANLSTVLLNDFDQDYGSRIYYKKHSFILKSFLFKDVKVCNNNKVAICISGASRGDWLNGLKDVIETFSKLFDIDCFVFTWEEVIEWPALCGGGCWVKRLLDPKFENISEEEVKKDIYFKKYFPNTSCILNKEIYSQSKVTANELEKLGNIKAYSIEKHSDFASKYGKVVNNSKLNYGVYRAFELMEEYEKQVGLKYDFVIRIRPDAKYISNLDLEKLHQLNNNELALNFFEYQNGTPKDFAVYGRRNTMEIYSKIWSYSFLNKKFDFFAKTPIEVHNHHVSRNWILLNDLQVVKTDIIEKLTGESLVSNGYIMPNISEYLYLDLLDLRDKFDAKKLDKFICFFQKVTEKYCKEKLNDSVYFSAKSRIKNHLAYQFGLVMIDYSRNILGYIKMPFVLFKTFKQYQNKKKEYYKKISENPKLVLPRIKEYTDYHEAIRLKESITYRLGQALIQANKTWYGGGYIRLLFEIRKLKREYCDKRKGNL
ncbi:capsular biosynthesis protein [Campylobacter lari subsp. concheus]|uniref:hypothetical protein n=3 Tax=Campylobacter lari TaxID=201 RepID=UPI00397D876D